MGSLNSSVEVKYEPPSQIGQDRELDSKLQDLSNNLYKEKRIEGAQVCVLDKNRSCLANVTSGTLGGLKSHVPMTSNALVLGYSCTKAIAATVAHAMVESGYLDYDEPVCDRVWTKFCPTREAPDSLLTSAPNKAAADVYHKNGNGN